MAMDYFRSLFSRKDSGSGTQSHESGGINLSTHLITEVHISGDAEEDRKSKLVGPGSFGNVYKGKYKDSPCAVKVFNRDVELQDCLKEAHVAMIVDDERHPNIVAFFGIWQGPDTGNYSLVMELCSTTLFDHLEEKIKGHNVSAFPIKSKLHLLQDISKAMIFLHGIEIVHGDLTAANVLLKKEPGTNRLVAKICDFGTSDFVTKKKASASGKKHGKDEFMPPEILSCTDLVELTYAVDVFSFGCLMIHVATCKFPKVQKGGTSEYTKRFNVTKDMKGDTQRILQPLVKQCLADEPSIRGNFQNLERQLGVHLNYYGEELAEILDKKSTECEKMRSRVTYLESESITLKKDSMTLVEARSTITRLKEELETLRGENNHLKMESQQHKSDLEESIGERRLLQQKLEYNQEEKDQAWSKIGSVDKTFEMYKQELKDKENLSKQLEKKTGDCEALIATTKNLQRHCDEYFKEKEDLARKKEELQENLSKKEAEVAGLNAAKAGLEEEMQSLQKAYQLLEVDANKFQGDLKTVIHQIQGDLKTAMKERDTYKTSLSSTKGIVNEKQQEIDKLKLEIATQTREMVRLKEERNGLQRDHTNNEEELKSFKSENLNLKTQTKQDRKTISDQKRRIDSLQSQLKKEEEKVAQKEQTITTLTNDKKRLDNTSKSSRKTITQLRGEIESKETKNKELTDEVETLETNLQTVTREKENFLHEKAILEVKKKELEKNVEELKLRITVREGDLKTKQDEIMKVTRERDDARQGEEKVQELQEKIAGLEMSNAEQKEFLQKKSAEFVKEKEKSNKLDNKHKQLLKDLEEKDNHIKEKNAELHILQSKVTNLEVSLQEETDTKENLDELNIELTKELNDTKDALRSSSNTVEEQKEQVRLLNEDYQRLVQRENHALISKKKQIENLELEVKGQKAEIEYLAGRARMITTFEEERNLVQQQLDKATEKFQCHVRESEKLEDSNMSLQIEINRLNKICESLKNELQLKDEESKTSKYAEKAMEGKIKLLEDKCVKYQVEIAHLVVQSQEIQTKYDIMSDRLEGKVNQDERRKARVRSLKYDQQELKKSIRERETELFQGWVSLHKEQEELKAEKESWTRERSLEATLNSSESFEELEGPNSVSPHTTNGTNGEGKPQFLDTEIHHELEENNKHLKSKLKKVRQAHASLLSTLDKETRELQNTQLAYIDLKNEVVTLRENFFESQKYFPFLCIFRGNPNTSSVEQTVIQSFCPDPAPSVSNPLKLEEIRSDKHWPWLRSEKLCITNVLKELDTTLATISQGYLSFVFLHYSDKVVMYRFHIALVPGLLTDSAQKRGQVLPHILFLYAKCELSEAAILKLSSSVRPSKSGILFQPSTCGFVPDLHFLSSLRMPLPEFLSPLVNWLDHHSALYLESQYNCYSNPNKSTKVPDCSHNLIFK